MEIEQKEICNKIYGMAKKRKDKRDLAPYLFFDFL